VVKSPKTLRLGAVLGDEIDTALPHRSRRQLRRLLRTRLTCWRLSGLFLYGGYVDDDVAFLHDQQLWPSILTSMPDHLPNSTRSPTSMSNGASNGASSSIEQLWQPARAGLAGSRRRAPGVVRGNLERPRRDQARWGRSVEDGSYLKRLLDLGFKALLPLEICSRTVCVSFANRSSRRRAMFLRTAIAFFSTSSIARALSVLATRNFSALANGSAG
jgi:hypothetical protein